MRLHVDKDLCSGQGRCYTLSPDLFESDDDGFPVQLGQDIEVGAGLEESAKRAIANCPEGAITAAAEGD